MKTTIFVLILFSMGCSKLNQFSIDGFETYYSSFVAATNRPSNNIIIELGDLSSQNYIGLCLLAPPFTPKVTIDQTWWAAASESDRQELIDHELGHCILGRVHLNTTLTNGEPTSIMNALHFDPNVISANSEYYYNELVYGK